MTVKTPYLVLLLKTEVALAFPSDKSNSSPAVFPVQLDSQQRYLGEHF